VRRRVHLLGEPPMLEESYCMLGYMLGFDQQVVAMISSLEFVLVRLGLNAQP
jgi:hypothetical protein